MTTSLNGLALPIKTETYVATQFPDSVQGVLHTMLFTFLGNSANTSHPDYTQLVGIHDFTTGQDVGNQEDFAPRSSLSFIQEYVFDNITVDYSASTAEFPLTWRAIRSMAALPRATPWSMRSASLAHRLMTSSGDKITRLQFLSTLTIPAITRCLEGPATTSWKAAAGPIS